MSTSLSAILIYHLYNELAVYNVMKVLSMVYTALILTTLGGMVVNIVNAHQVDFQDCPAMVDTASGMDFNTTEISNDSYCIVDKCYVRLGAIAQQLEVTSASGDYLMATNMDTEESVVISRLSDELICSFKFAFYNGFLIVIKVLAFIFRFLLILLIAVASGYVLGIHVLFKVLCSLLGKLLIVYNTALLVALFASLLLIISNLLFAPGSQAVCQVFVHGYSLTFMLYESIGTVVTAQVYYLMYRDYKNMGDISATWSSQLFEHYMMFAFAPMLPMAILTIGFDFTAQVGNNTILPSGHCILPPSNLYESLFLAYMYIGLHKIGQFLVFCYTLYYFHKLYMSFGNKQHSTTIHVKPNSQPANQADTQSANHSIDSSDTNNSDQNNNNIDDDDNVSSLDSTSSQADDDELQEYNNERKLRENMSEEEIRTEKRRYLRRLMISASFPGATIMSLIFWFLCLAVGPLLKPFSAGGGDVALLAQQATIAAVFLSSKKIFALCKERFEAFAYK